MKKMFIFLSIIFIFFGCSTIPKSKQIPKPKDIFFLSSVQTSKKDVALNFKNNVKQYLSRAKYFSFDYVVNEKKYEQISPWYTAIQEFKFKSGEMYDIAISIDNGVFYVTCASADLSNYLKWDTFAEYKSWVDRCITTQETILKFLNESIRYTNIYGLSLESSTIDGFLELDFLDEFSDDFKDAIMKLPSFSNRMIYFNNNINKFKNSR